jgi:hypothetical protein
MIEQRELISICRQIGSMMEAGVDILRVTRVLRAQTENPRILNAYDSLDHDLRMGQSLADAMEQVPEMFSPFAVSLVRQGEARNDLAGAFYRIADFLQKEDEVDVAHQHHHSSSGDNSARSTPAAAPNPYSVVTPSAILPVWVVDDLINRAQVAALRIFTVVSGLLLSLAAVWGSIEAGWVEKRWQNVVICSVAALFIGGSGVWLRRRIDADRRKELERRRLLEEEAARAFEDKETTDKSAASSTSIAPATPQNRNSRNVNKTSNGGPPSAHEATFE